MDESEEYIILVNAEDRETGIAPKIEAHRKGLLHRAISISIVDDSGRMLLQKRSAQKYHSGGLWTNACCTHPRQDETTHSAAMRRLSEELGISCDLTWRLRTQYCAPMSNGLFENEVVHLFSGSYLGKVTPNPNEVEAYEWIDHSTLRNRIASQPDAYTYWFKYYLDNFAAEMFFGSVTQ